jgi:hypothetical protein
MSATGVGMKFQRMHIIERGAGSIHHALRGGRGEMAGNHEGAAVSAKDSQYQADIR